MSMGASVEGGARTTKASAWLYLDEVTHRTLNDYSVMLAMLRRAAGNMTDAAGLATLDAIAKRLRAGAAACSALRPPANSGVRQLEDHLEHLCSSLTSSILEDRSISLRLVAEPVRLSAEKCWQISLIVSELVMNAARHAFFFTAGGAIAVNARVIDGIIECAVVDNGVAKANVAPGRGSSILDMLAADLGGTIARRFTEAGSTVVLRVPLN